MGRRQEESIKKQHSGTQGEFLHALFQRRFADAKDCLGRKGVDPNCVLEFWHGTVLSECPSSYKHPALTVAIQAGLEIAKDDALAFMADEDDVCEVVRLLIDLGADVNAVGEEDSNCESMGMTLTCDKTALCAAIQRGSPKLVRLLLDAGADPNHTFSYGFGISPHRLKKWKLESWLCKISLGSVNDRAESDPRCQNNAEIQALLQAARTELTRPRSQAELAAMHARRQQGELIKKQQQEERITSQRGSGAGAGAGAVLVAAAPLAAPRAGASETAPRKTKLAMCWLCHEKPCTVVLFPCGLCAQICTRADRGGGERETGVARTLLPSLIHLCSRAPVSRSQVCVPRVRKDLLRAEVVPHPVMRREGGAFIFICHRTRPPPPANPPLGVFLDIHGTAGPASPWAGRELALP